MKLSLDRAIWPIVPLPSHVLTQKDYHWGQGGLETGDYMLGTFRAHVHLSHNVTGG